MPFDMGFNCRASSGFVTDPTYCVPVLGELYPHTYTNVDGYSVNGGFDTAPSTYDGASGNDPRIAGSNYFSTPRVFQVDLSSGSAPGAGTYDVDLAVNIVGQAHNVIVTLKDDTTTLLDVTGSAIDADHYIDATGADVGPVTTTWTGTQQSYPFATTTALVSLGATNFNGLTHFRLALQAGGATAVRRRLMLLGVGS